MSDTIDIDLSLSGTEECKRCRIKSWRHDIFHIHNQIDRCIGSRDDSSWDGFTDLGSDSWEDSSVVVSLLSIPFL